MLIEGDPETGAVWIDGDPLPLARSLTVRNHSPDGFAWGYAGSGPAQLALAILLAAGAPDDVAARLYQVFKTAYVQHWPMDQPIAVDVDVAAWLRAHR